MRRRRHSMDAVWIEMVRMLNFLCLRSDQESGNLMLKAIGFWFCCCLLPTCARAGRKAVAWLSLAPGWNRDNPNPGIYMFLFLALEHFSRPLAVTFQWSRPFFCILFTNLKFYWFHSKFQNVLGPHLIQTFYSSKIFNWHHFCWLAEPLEHYFLFCSSWGTFSLF